MTKEERAFLEAMSDRLLIFEKRLLKLEKSIGNRALAKALKYDELKALPAKLGISVKSVVPFFDETGHMNIRVSYDISDKFVRMPDQGEYYYDEGILAMNELGMVSLEDMKKISDAVKRCMEK